MKIDPGFVPVEAYLRSVGDIRRDIRRSRTRLRELEALGTNEKGKTPTGMAESLTDSREYYTRRIVDAVRGETEADRLLDAIDGNPVGRRILRLHFCDGLDWDGVEAVLASENVFYSRRQMFRLQTAAMYSLLELMPQELIEFYSGEVRQ